MELVSRLSQNMYGGKRIVSPKTTLDNIMHLMSNVNLFKVSNMVQFEASIFIAYANICGQNSTGVGKGMNDDCAKASAIMEMIERYSGRTYQESRIVRNSFANLSNKALDPKKIIFDYDELYNENAVIDFVEGYMLNKKTPIMVPAAFAYYAYNCQLIDGKLEYTKGGIKTVLSTNGLASGNCIEEAILQGLYEVIERDAVFSMWLNKMPTADLENFHGVNEYLDCILSEFEKKGIDIKVKLIKNDIDCVYNIFCFMINKNCKNDMITFAFGCGTHSDPEIALSRAISEVGQIAVSLSIQRKQLADERFRRNCDEQHIATLMKFDELSQLDELSFLLDESEKIDFKTLHNYSQDDILTEINKLYEELERNGLDTIVVDLTSPELNIPVVRVLVPGMQGPIKQGLSGIYTDRLFQYPERFGQPRRRIEELNTFELI